MVAPALLKRTAFKRKFSQNLRITKIFPFQCANIYLIKIYSEAGGVLENIFTALPKFNNAKTAPAFSRSTFKRMFKNIQ